MYEIKPFLGIEKGKEQLNAYIQGINHTTSYNAVEGTTFNPNGLILDYPGNPKKEIIYKTKYDVGKGIITYNVRNKKNNERPPIRVWGEKYNSDSEDEEQMMEEQDNPSIAAIVGLIAVIAFGIANDAVGFVADDGAVAAAVIALIAILNGNNNIKQEDCIS